MTVFASTLNQMGFLLLLIAIGYILTKFDIIPGHCAADLSLLENNVFIPALVVGTFMSNFTVKSLSSAWQYLLAGCVLAVIAVPVGILLAKFFAKDDYKRKIYTYGLVFSNFGFMGNAVVGALFPEMFMNYLIFVIPFWILIYLWAVPCLLMPDSGEKKSLLGGLKKLLNPMFIAMIVGMLLGILGIKLPQFMDTSVTTLGSCMSPVAMLLTGMTIAKIDLKATFTNVPVYGASVIRLVLLPLLAIGVLWAIDVPYGLALCTVCFLAMPLGLNTIVIPAAYGKDTSDAAGMALISHLMSCGTIPLVFLLFENLCK